ncbi:unnamed protein product [Brachionus calyciflorus]|uniref:Coiled-coil domain-containing protein 13 n=1 Tax=Brachionus calyciflorus TaxID=104777 RepID=A0A814IHX3_9BILA|nr:unnamed protein product [Brachionus calyciflorus]
MTNRHNQFEYEEESNYDFDTRKDEVFNLNNLVDSSDEDEIIKPKKITKPPVSSKKTSEKPKTPMNTNLDSLTWSEKFRELQDENTRLRKISAEKDYEIKYLKKKLDEDKTLFPDGPITNEVAATKIIDLGKKCRELTAQLESEKTKNLKLTKSIKDLENKMDNMDPVKKSYDDENKENSLKNENKELKEKLNSLTHNLMELKSQSEILKQDLKKAHKVLEKEVGEHVDIKSLLSGQTNWKGRQQQIILLQNKLETLKKKMSLNESNFGSRLDDDDLNDTGFLMNETRNNKAMSIYSGSAVSARTNFDRMHMDDLKRIERDKREKIDKLKKENEAFESDLAKMKEKADSLKVRVSVLSNENKTLKDQVKTLLEKGKHDNELIDILMKKQNQFKDIIESLTVQNEKATKEIQEKSVEVGLFIFKNFLFKTTFY